MTTVIGVRFKKAGKVYYFDPCDVWPKPGDHVVVETSRGVELGEVIAGAREVADEQIVAPLKKVVRVATPEDVHRAEYNRMREKEAHDICHDRIAQHKLEMKLVDVEYTFDGSKIVFYFTANGRVDFRDLVKDLASVFKMRIELRQIGVRDEAKMLGGLGSCGRPICCGAFLGDFQPVSIKMAKEQNLSLNPTKISGQCGRLMCCLKYEQENYEKALKRLPRVGREGMTPDGPGTVIDINVIKEKVRVRFRQGDTVEVREYPLEEVSKMAPAEGGNHPPQGAKPDRADKGERAEKSGDAKPPRPRKPRPPRDKDKEGQTASASDTAPRDKRPRDRRKDQAPDAPAGGGAEKPEKPQRRRPPRPKGPKQASTDAYFDKINQERTAPASGATPPADSPAQAPAAPPPAGE